MIEAAFPTIPTIVANNMSGTHNNSVSLSTTLQTHNGIRTQTSSMSATNANRCEAFLIHFGAKAQTDNTRTEDSSHRRPSFSRLEQVLQSCSGSFTPKDESNSPEKITKQIFFDCDNTLVDTEALTAEACVTVINKCLADHGSNHIYTVEQLIYSFFGFTARKMCTLISKIYGFEITPQEMKDLVDFEEQAVIDLIYAAPKPTSGVVRFLEELSKDPSYKLSVVSSSPIRRIRAALDAAGIAKYFDHDQVYSAKNSLSIPKGKPDPAVYIHAMEQNNVHPWQCVAFEDSKNGARSAFLAGIPCVAFLGTYDNPGQHRNVAELLQSEGCDELISNWTEAEAALERVESTTTELANTCLQKYAEHEARNKEFDAWLARLFS